MDQNETCGKRPRSEWMRPRNILFILEVGYLCSNDHACLLTLGSHVNIANLLEPALKDANITTEAHHLDAVNAVCSP